jgi:hypothetical protein
MILRKLSHAIQQQNWSTVVLEILIVVIGIYIGLQADEWNQNRKEDQRAEQVLEDLRVEFAAIEHVASGLADYYKEIVDNLGLLTASVRAGEIKAQDEATIRDAIANGGNFGDPPPPSGTFRDLMSSGNLALIRDKDLRLRLIEYDQSLSVIVESDKSINNMLGHFAFAFRRHAIFGESFQLPESPNLAFVDARLPTATEVDFEAILVDPDFRVAAEQHLGSQIGRYINIRVSQSKIVRIQDLIDQELGVGATSTEESR